MPNIEVRVIDAYVYRTTSAGLLFLVLKRAKTKNSKPVDVIRYTYESITLTSIFAIITSFGHMNICLNNLLTILKIHLH